jgi:hypothetical protein
MKQVLVLEYLGGFALAIYLFSIWHLPWWWFAALFFVPDVGMLGYLFSPKLGAFTYNLFHHLGLASVVLIAGMAADVVGLKVAGSVLIGHLFFDRVFGYGLKYADAFKHTHLGTLK